MAEIQKPRHLIIAGVNKGGKATLFSALGRHPDICPSSVKETCYFLPERYGGNRELPQIYQRYFDAADREQWLLEATPGYLYGGDRLIKAIRQVTGGDTKILVVLREPVSRAFSYFRDKKSMLELPQNADFSDYIERCLEKTDEDLAKEESNLFFGLEGGKYADYLQVWIEEFGNDLRIVFFDDLVDDQVVVLTEICAWLDVDVDQIIVNVKEGVRENRTMYTRYRFLQWLAVRTYRVLEVFFRRHHQAKGVLTRFYYFLNRGKSDKEILEPADKARLQEFYHPYNQRLANLLTDRQNTLPDWLEQKG
ncbi:MAG: sulfotransferase domain-containing protein [Gammaproteobacteria bacterium]|jgi:hypothetical protein|nr:sulfotransferase domain-containing protein [Gammaproteobacteria bacterium]